jgi:hypothetical protein
MYRLHCAGLKEVTIRLYVSGAEFYKDSFEMNQIFAKFHLRP